MTEKKPANKATKKADGEAEVLANIAAMPEPDRAIAERLHAIIKASAPILSPRLWYGMPAYAKDGKVVCFFQSAQKFKTRYATFGFQHEANLDDGAMWPVAFAVKELTAAEEAQITALGEEGGELSAHSRGRSAPRPCRSPPPDSFSGVGRPTRQIGRWRLLLDGLRLGRLERGPRDLVEPRDRLRPRRPSPWALTSARRSAPWVRHAPHRA